MIRSFADDLTRKVALGVHDKRTAKLPPEILPIARRKLDMIHFSQVLQDLRVPPANRLESLKGKLAGYFSIRINDQWRIIFKWVDNAAENVQITDYH